MLEVQVIYQLQGVKEMSPVAMIVTTTLVFQFLLQFYPYIIVHFIFSNFYTWGMLPPKSKKCFDSLGLSYKMSYLTSTWQLWTSHFFSSVLHVYNFISASAKENAHRF